MIDNLIAGIIVAALAGLTAIAHKFPPLYRPIYGPLVALTAVVSLGQALFNYGYLESALTFLDKYIQEQPSTTLASLRPAYTHTLHLIAWYPLVALLICGYLTLLWYLPRLIKYAQAKMAAEKQ